MFSLSFNRDRITSLANCPNRADFIAHVPMVLGPASQVSTTGPKQDHIAIFERRRDADRTVPEDRTPGHA